MKVVRHCREVCVERDVVRNSTSLLNTKGMAADLEVERLVIRVVVQIFVVGHQSQLGYAKVFWRFGKG
jgi:hypothetical protein